MEELHVPYRKRLGREPDFKVVYRFFGEHEGGRSSPPFQGYRSDFWYEDEEERPGNIFMIWPEFLDEYGDVVLKVDHAVAVNGEAYMWVVNPDAMPYHRKHLRVGATGFFHEGARRVAECTVVQLIGLTA